MMAALPEVTDWVGAVGVGIVAAGVEYFDEPAMAAILLEAPTDQYQVFSGIAPLPAVLPGAHPTCSTRFTARSALVHSDVQTPELPDLLADLAQRTHSGAVFGGWWPGGVPMCSLPTAAESGCGGKVPRRECSQAV